MKMAVEDTRDGDGGGEPPFSVWQLCQIINSQRSQITAWKKLWEDAADDANAAQAVLDKVISAIQRVGRV